MRGLAVELTRISNDLRLLASGPRTGLTEITLPAIAPGSSIMPGKINPSMLEMLNMVCFQVMGGDLALCAAAAAGQLELNVMMPVIAFNLHLMIEIMANALEQVRVRCIDGLEADAEHCREYAEKSLGLAAALSPKIGYARASALARKALEQGKTISEIAIEEGVLTAEEAGQLFNLEGLTSVSPRRKAARTRVG